MTDKSTEDYWQLNIPKLHGYKTIIVNVVMFAYMAISIVYPGTVAPAPETIGLSVEQFLAALGAVHAFVNSVLRLMTRGPVPEPINVLGVQPKGGKGVPVTKVGEMVNEAYEDGRKHGALEIAPGPSPDTMNALGFVGQGAGMLSSKRELGEALGLWPVGRDDFKRPLDEERLNAIPAAPRTPMTLGAARVIMATPTAQHLAPGLDVVVDEARELVAQADYEEKLRQSNREGLAAAQKTTRLKVVLAFLIPFLSPSLLILSGVGAMTLAGCSTVQQVNAVAAAETLEQRAFALYGSYVTLQERGAEIVRDRSVSKSVRKAIQAADRIAHPAAQAVLQGVREVAATRKALDAIPAGEDTEQAVQRVRVVTAALQRSVTTLGPRIEALSRAIAAARG